VFLPRVFFVHSSIFNSEWACPIASTLGHVDFNAVPKCFFSFASNIHSYLVYLIASTLNVFVNLLGSFLYSYPTASDCSPTFHRLSCVFFSLDFIPSFFLVGSVLYSIEFLLNFFYETWSIRMGQLMQTRFSGFDRVWLGTSKQLWIQFDCVCTQFWGDLRSSLIASWLSFPQF